MPTEMTPQETIIELNRCKANGYMPTDWDRRCRAIEAAKAALEKQLPELTRGIPRRIDKLLRQLRSGAGLEWRLKQINEIILATQKTRHKPNKAKTEVKKVKAMNKPTIESAMIELNRLKTTERMDIDRERLTAAIDRLVKAARKQIPQKPYINRLFVN